MGMVKTMSPIVMINHILTIKNYDIIMLKCYFSTDVLPRATHYFKSTLKLTVVHKFLISDNIVVSLAYFFLISIFLSIFYLLL